MYIYAQINKETLRFVRQEKALSFDYIDRITHYPESKVSSWEDDASDKFPTINQAKSIAKCYRVPFAGLYMNSTDINVKHLPKMRNLRTLPEATIDNSALNLAIADVLSARDLLIESKTALKEPIPSFDIFISTINIFINTMDEDIVLWARQIRESLRFDIEIQYKCPSARQFYLYVRNIVETTGVFVHSFTGVETEIVRGFAIYEDELPMIGLNNGDRYPAKLFSIIHELVHLIKRSSSVCNEMMSSFSWHAEEVFCNAVAGEVLVPKLNLIKQLGSYVESEIDLDLIDHIAQKFSVSKEVICRRLLDCGKISHSSYITLNTDIRIKFEHDRETARADRKMKGSIIPRNISREAIDQNSGSLCRTFYHGYQTGYFDKQDISRYLGVKQGHVDKFLWEVSKW